MPDLSITSMKESAGIRWRTIEDLSSDHVLVAISWIKEAMINKKVMRTEPNLKKVDWRRYRELIEEGLVDVVGEENMREKLAKFTSLMIEEGIKVCPTKVIRAENILWMTADIKRLRRERNRARRDMGR